MHAFVLRYANKILGIPGGFVRLRNCGSLQLFGELLACLDDATKRALLQDMNDLLGIKPLFH